MKTLTFNTDLGFGTDGNIGGGDDCALKRIG